MAKRRLGSATGEQEQLSRLLLERVQKLVSLTVTISATNKGLVIGNGIYQQDVDDNTVFTESLRLRKIQEVSSTEIYLGYSPIGTADGASNSWELVHILLNQGTGSDETWTTYAIGDWTNRTTAPYS